MPSSALVISPVDRVTLESWTRSSTMPAGHVERARIVLAVADGAGTSGAARLVGVSRPTVIKWRDRFAASGLTDLLTSRVAAGPRRSMTRRSWRARWSRLQNRWRSRTGRVDCWAAISASGMPRWPGRGADTGSSRGGARRSNSPPTRNWRPRYGRDRLVSEPAAKAIVLCVDEKSQIQALNRTQPILPMRPGLPEKATHDYQRNGTATLFAALEIATGKVTDRCYERHGKAEFWTSSRPSPVPTPGGNCMWCATTTTPTNTPTSTHGWSKIRG